MSDNMSTTEPDNSKPVDNTDAGNQVTYNAHVKRNISTWSGGRPFWGAIDAYVNLMMQKLEGCIKYLHAKPEHTFAEVRVMPNQILYVGLDDGTEATYKFHIVHYGPLKDKEQAYWMSRFNIYENLQVYPPFRTLQVEMLSRGYFLVDESDPDKSKRMVIRLYRTKPAYPRYLWHGFGVIPNLGVVAPSLVLGNLNNVDTNNNVVNNQ